MLQRISQHALRHAVEIGVLVEQAVITAFGARAVVADDVEDQRIVELARVLDRLDEAADLCVGIFAEASEHFHLPCEQPLFVVAELVPILDSFGLGASSASAGTTPSAFWRASVSSRTLSQP